MKKLGRKGFTLAELLIAVLLLGFVCVMVTVMTSAILSTTATMQEVAQAEILGSEALENLQNELRFGQGIVVSENSVTLTRHSTNKNSTIKIGDDNEEDKELNGRIVVMFDKTSKGEGGVEAKETVTELLFGGTSYGNLKIADLKFEKKLDTKEEETAGEETKEKKETGTITISLSVKYGDDTLWSGSVSVRPINGLTAAPKSA